MRVRLITLMSGPEGTFQPGSVLNLPAKKARELVNGGYAVFEEKQRPQRETATRAERETRTTDKDDETPDKDDEED